MRTYGRLPLSIVVDSSGNPIFDSNGNVIYGTSQSGASSWIEVTTDSSGQNDLVMLTTLLQVLQLQKGESPFYAQYGVSARQSIIQQIAPDYDMSVIQQQFSPFFASLVITKKSATLAPTYNVNVITNQGVTLSAQVPS
jgi:hypothetical protein